MQRFRALYIEREALEYEHGRRLVELFDDRPVVQIDRAAEVFSRPGQDFQLQKRSAALIAGVAHEPYIYEAPTRVCGVPDQPVYYNDQLRNCVYNCDYCFLQGMHPSGHTLVAVNSGDFRAAAERTEGAQHYWLSVSYLTDIAAFEPWLPLASEWVGFAREHPRITIEIRSKGETPRFVRDAPAPNVVLIWTLSPDEVAGHYERGCASLQNRLMAMRQAIDRGWRVRIAMDPIVLVPEWRAAYGRLVELLESRFDAREIDAATYGVFRIGADYMNRMRSARADSPILHHPFDRTDGLVTYTHDEMDAVRSTVGTRLENWLGAERVELVHG